LLLNGRIKFIQCQTLSYLTDELSKVSQPTRHLLIDCLSGLVHTFMLSVEIQDSIESGMRTVGSMLIDVVQRNPGIRIYVAQPLARQSEDSRGFCNLARVTFYNYFIICLLFDLSFVMFFRQL